MKKLLLTSFVLAPLVYGAAPPEPTFNEIDALLSAAVAEKRVPLVVASVADGEGVVYQHASGTSIDAIFAIASMTKPVTSVAVMQLVEAGEVKLDEPAQTYLPELGAVRVLDGGSLRPPKSPVTVRQLLTPTAGFGYEFMNREIAGLVARKEIASMMGGGDAFLKAPLLFDPGTRWEYGISTDWLGRLVEEVSGQSLEAYFRERIFAPLGMWDSFFDVPPDKQSRVVATFSRTPDGGLAQQHPRPPAPPGEFFSGGGGLHSTAPDYMKLVRALLAGGRLGQRRILEAETVATMGQKQIGDLVLRPFSSLVPEFATDGAVLPGVLDKFGLGFALNSKPGATARGLNTMAWVGIYNTFFWIDRGQQIGGVLMTQMLPGLDPGAKKLYEDFDRAVYAWRARRVK
jgi:CubicO group peptidase (beta-lactamase class C family)